MTDRRRLRVEQGHKRVRTYLGGELVADTTRPWLVSENFDSEATDAWFEEDEQIYVHPRDPHTRVDVLRSSRHVEVPRPRAAPTRTRPSTTR